MIMTANDDDGKIIMNGYDSGSNFITRIKSTICGDWQSVSINYITFITR